MLLAKVDWLEAAPRGGRALALVFGGLYNRVAALALTLAHIPPLLLGTHCVACVSEMCLVWVSTRRARGRKWCRIKA